MCARPYQGAAPNWVSSGAASPVGGKDTDAAAAAGAHGSSSAPPSVLWAAARTARRRRWRRHRVVDDVDGGAVEVAGDGEGVRAARGGAAGPSRRRAAQVADADT